MTKTIIFSTLLLLGFSTTSAMANNTQLIELASKQESISKTITKNYKQNPSSTLKLLNQLESGHNTLKSTVHTAELSNLLTYLHICVKDLKQIMKQPYNSQNARLVADLSASLTEGNHYIAQAL